MSHPILVLDDEEDFLDALCELLRERSFSVIPFTNPKDALGALEKEEFSVVLSDYRMPDLNGGEFLIELRKINPKIPVIFLSAFMDVSNMVQVSQKGVTSILEKPVDSDTLIKELSKYVSPSDQDQLLRNDSSSKKIRPMPLIEVFQYASDRLDVSSINLDLWGVILMHYWKDKNELDACVQILQVNPTILPAQLSLHLERKGISLFYRQVEGLDLKRALEKEMMFWLSKMDKSVVNSEVVELIKENAFSGEGFNLSTLG